MTTKTHYIVKFGPSTVYPLGHNVKYLTLGEATARIATAANVIGLERVTTTTRSESLPLPATPASQPVSDPAYQPARFSGDTGLSPRIASVMLAIAKHAPKLARAIEARGYFLTSDDVKALVKIIPESAVLLRCGNGRFCCTVRELYNSGADRLVASTGHDYLRDVSFPC